MSEGVAGMEESRVDRLMRLAEEAAITGDTDRTENLLNVLRPAIYLEKQEVKALKKMVSFAEVTNSDV